jgi:DnaJ-class molecular chaperone
MSKSLRVPAQRTLHPLNGRSFRPAVTPSTVATGCGNCGGYGRVKVRIGGVLHVVTCRICGGSGR